MSISLMTEAWKLQDLTSTQKLVLLSLADNANDQGECYPSIATIVFRTCLCERAVQNAIGALSDMGYVKSRERLGTSTMYYLDLSPDAGKQGQLLPRRKRTPAPNAPPALDAPPHQMHPASAPGAPPPPHQVHPTPAPGAPKPSLNRQSNRHLTVKAKPSPPPKPPSPLCSVELPEWLPRQTWVDWVEHRIAVKVPMTERAASLAIKHLDALRQGGEDPVKVIEQSVRSGKWTDLYPVKPANAGASAGGAPDAAYGQWWMSDAATDRLATDLGIPARQGESYSGLRDRIKVELARRKANQGGAA